MGEPKDLSLWDQKEVEDWIERIGLGEFKEYFEEHSIDGEVLPDLNNELLEEMGIEDEEKRNKLLKEIETEVSKSQTHQSKKTMEKKKLESKKSTLGRNLVDVYSEGANVEENDSVYSHADRHGFIDDIEGSDDVQGNATKKVIEREKKWQKMIGTKKKPSLQELRKFPKFRKRVYKGIPYSWRIQMWKLMTVGEIDNTHSEKYQEMLSKETAEVDENQIDLDINRTLRNHINYKQRYGKGQMKLFNILRAYANYNTEVGFCQGMASVAAFLLIHCDEETTFFIMDKLVSDDLFSLKGLWIAGFPTLMESFYVHDKLFKFHLPKLWKHFRNQKIHPSSYATRWYMTIFLSFPFHTCLRVWDIFFLDGFDVLFFCAVAALEYFQVELLGRDFEGIMEFLGQMSKQEIDDNKLIQLLTRVMRKTYSGMSGRSKAIKLLREQYKKHVAEGGSPLGDF